MEIGAWRLALGGAGKLSVKIENEEIYRTRSRAQSVGGAGLSENVKM